MKVDEAIGRAIARMGAAQIFGIVGSGNFRTTGAMIDEGVPFVSARHEMGAACMADAHARATGRLAVLSVHQGCGLSNALTGIGEAAKSRTPVLVVAGDTPGVTTAATSGLIRTVSSPAWEPSRSGSTHRRPRCATSRGP
ncbi:thiamine pyrophosphate-binding protein [Blastococcus brunescens]|uniref:Thiamine pyrophosphate-binding protein n=1 Tax=Blastococcus brunescens TaxID=1564165 RepID=A0ABZ1B2R4_9ACTN|nr:thiamine pyrophosphate-binding protein [Blastococcus sp. BMG 8361]WRL65100.1 thiamine pyrophosphate-binding protein [Blastococcus sp. BMG 8361]